jgi:hypothetical protein
MSAAEEGHPRETGSAGIGAQQADVEPDKGCPEVANADAALHETGALAYIYGAMRRIIWATTLLL